MGLWGGTGFLNSSWRSDMRMDRCWGCIPPWGCWSSHPGLMGGLERCEELGDSDLKKKWKTYTRVRQGIIKPIRWQSQLRDTFWKQLILLPASLCLICLLFYTIRTWKLATHTTGDTWRIRNLRAWWPNWNRPIEGLWLVGLPCFRVPPKLLWGFPLACEMVSAECQAFVSQMPGSKQKD